MRKGRQAPSPQQLKAIAEALGISLDDLLGIERKVARPYHAEVREAPLFIEPALRVRDLALLVEAFSRTRSAEGALLERLRYELGLVDETEWSKFSLDRLVEKLSDLDFPRRADGGKDS